MGYFRRKMKSFIQWCVEDTESEKIIEETRLAKKYRAASAINTLAGSSHQSVGDGVNGMNFTVYNATGGKVVQLRTYSPNTDTGRTTLYVITEKDDLGEELGMIITRETLSQ